MANSVLSGGDLWKKVEEDRLREERVLDPYLIAFRATPAEIELRRAEDAKEAASGERDFSLRAERLARSGREAVRFERYLIRQGFYPNTPKDDPCGVEP
jgi:hypothetical protein